MVCRMSLRLGLLAGLLIALAGPGVAEAAPWCGTTATADRPAGAAGHTIRVLYVVPSDGADRSAELAPRLWAEVEEIDVWWRTNDSSRALNFDVAPFACGPQVDLQVRRASAGAGQLQPAAGRFSLLRDDILGRAGADILHAKFLVYYDGPVDSPNLCGEGGGSPTGTGIAIVYLQACPRSPASSVATHELLHALGALRDGAGPNSCPGDSGHVCDSTGDILYPFVQLAPLSSVVLDVGRNDYYGHAQSWFDVQDSLWLRRLDASAALSVRLQGSGTVRSDVPGVLCSAACATSWNRGSQVLLTATPAAGQRFVGWSGACQGATLNCGLILEGDAAVTARFAVARFPLTLAVAGRGRISGAGAPCAVERCLRQATSHRTLTLRAVPAKGWRLRGWTGACRGARATCSVPMSKATSVRATFVRRAARS
jgi:Divergent InlB B-repeat domain